jgi:hypothetical protein
VEPTVAQRVARRAHVGQLTRSGEPVIDHVERVARAVRQELRAVAYLHDVLERTAWTLAELCAKGLAHAELSVLELLTRSPTQSYEEYVMRIARARGRAGRIARTIKLADLDDHLCQRAVPGNPDYAWARAQIEASRRRRDEQLSVSRPAHQTGEVAA